MLLVLEAFIFTLRANEVHITLVPRAGMRAATSVVAAVMVMTMMVVMLLVLAGSGGSVWRCSASIWEVTTHTRTWRMLI
jgi:hypothetical protein